MSKLYLEFKGKKYLLVNEFYFTKGYYVELQGSSIIPTYTISYDRGELSYNHEVEDLSNPEFYILNLNPNSSIKFLKTGNTLPNQLSINLEKFTNYQIAIFIIRLFLQSYKFALKEYNNYVFLKY